MPIYQWKDDAAGRLKKGEIEAVNEAAVMAQLRAQRLVAGHGQGEAEGLSEYLAVPEAEDHDQGSRDLHAAVCRR